MSGAVEIAPAETPSAAEAPVEQRKRSLKEMLLHGSSWTLVEYGGSQVLRFGSSIILAHLLKDPAIFGVNLIVSVFMQGISMFSDLGIGQSVVQSKRGADPRFLNTAWTMQILRGVFFTIAAFFLAWPVSRVYGNEAVLYALPFAGLAGIIEGFNSTKLFLLNRDVRLARLAAINIVTQVIAIIGTVTFAYFSRTVYALIGGALLSTLVKMIASHVFCPGPANRLAWDKSSTQELFHFGKWIFFSTLFGFLASRGDQLLMGWYMPIALFGTFGWAVFLKEGVVQGMHQISQRVLFPLYARIAQESPGRLREQTFRVRAVLILLSVPPVCVLVVWGNEIITLLFPEKFHQAGWMLQVLSAGAIVSVIGSTVGPVLLAVGDSYRFMVIQASRAVILCVTMFLGGFIGSVVADTAVMPAIMYPVYFDALGHSVWGHGRIIGVIVGATLPELFLYPVLIWAVRRYGVWLPKLDFAGFAFALVLIAIGFML
ncbi:MAG: oligosaccharide flippase family protein [Candidatus Hydrogenedentes bacterium]|nr:oligosaccharide flippase family protein [Candidatus Hydrogenedentota bacterium]